MKKSSSRGMGIPGVRREKLKLNYSVGSQTIVGVTVWKRRVSVTNANAH